ncbi:helix-turn-helix domain-containing protein [Mycolicibacter sp. MYC123]|uniref:Helix-turn-helix domain-containing protein n=1 Tax=[Mycobacterium] zoologicum TaxID=2872311 RepID=A0ABU5YHS8_9MYCO|nr:helix-turn-helix domain-containing protein [Mycolicibacter sp. MYC123]MEB3048999.1 helix-turn-helix domain-containing protein [Mycolicibacter sp. MYC123]
MPELLEVNEVSKIMHTPAETLKRWRRIGYGPQSAKFGRRVLYRRTDVEAWITDRFASQ